MDKFLAYIHIARPDHWFKNVFMLLGVVLAYFMMPHLDLAFWAALGEGFIAVCLVASSNYVINEILDAPTDRHHPDKQHRPIPSGKVNIRLAYVEWLALGAAGLFLSWQINRGFFFSALALWIMGIIYNVRPFRSKEIAYLDVLSESINNPLRLLLGWFILVPNKMPPVSLWIAYWMIGAFFMALKRYAEFRTIADPGAAASYRSSFRHYTDDRLLVSSFFYALVGCLFGGIFIVRYHLELVLLMPFACLLIAYYFRLGLREHSPVQHPEKLYREKRLSIFGFLFVLLFIVMMFVEIPALYNLFNVDPSSTKPLWSFGPNHLPRP